MSAPAGSDIGERRGGGPGNMVKVVPLSGGRRQSLAARLKARADYRVPASSSSPQRDGDYAGRATPYFAHAARIFEHQSGRIPTNEIDLTHGGVRDVRKGAVLADRVINVPGAGSSRRPLRSA